MARWAVFDVDGTLLPGTSMEKMFLLHLWQKRALPLRNLFYFLLSAAVRSILYGRDEGFKNNKQYLRDLPEQAVIREGKALFRDRIWPAVSAEGLRRMETCRRQGYRILLMSGSPDFLTLQLARKTGPDKTLATRMEARNGHFTGKVVGLHPYGIRKKMILQRASKALALNFRESVVFANHHSDIAHMALFGRPVAVNPDRGLQEAATRRGWEVEWWR